MPSMRFSTRSRRLENAIAPSMIVMRSIERSSVSPENAAGLGEAAASRMRSRSSGTYSTGRVMTSSRDLRVARPHARQRHVGLHAVDGQATGAVAVLRILQRDVVQGDVQRAATGRSWWCRRSSADSRSRARPAPGSPRSGSPRESRRPAAARQDDDDGGDGGAGDFQCSHVDIPTRANGIESRPAVGAAAPAFELIPERGARSKPTKIIRGCCKVM